MTTYSLSELVEATTDVVPDRVALVAEQRQLSFADLDARANQLAHHLRAAGFGPGDMIGLHLHNGPEYVEAMLAAFKIRAVPVNINYRYVAGELETLYRYTELVALIFHREFSSVVGPVIARVPAIRHVLVVADHTEETTPEGATEYESVLRDQPTSRSFSGRSSGDIYVTCTGGTTGAPKAVLWRHEDLVFAAFNGGDMTGRLGPVTAPEQLAERARRNPPTVQLALAPLMHVTGHWAVLAFLIGGGTTILAPPGKLDPAKIWQLVTTHGVNMLSLVGDAMARPLIDEYERHPVPASSLDVIGSGGARISPSTKDAIRRALPDVAIFDGLGSSESGIIARSQTFAGQAGRSKFPVDSTVAVLDEMDRPLPPGSAIVGRLARRGHLPLGYFRDEAKSKATFVEIDGQRWVIPGDMAILEQDGTITLYGRGSTSINTGGEKVFPEEVEQVLMAHPKVADTLVVGRADDRWGERVVAIIQPAGDDAPTLEEIQDHARAHLAGYKLPRDLLVVERVERMPNGKADLRWAKGLLR